MEVRIWDIKKEKYIKKANIRHIYQSVGKTYFKLDKTRYETSEYDIQFIHNEG